MSIQPPSTSLLCFCVKKFPDGEDLVNDNVFYFTPHWIENNILIYGYKKSYFPFQLLVGPHWPVMLTTYVEIISISVIFIIYVSEAISRIMTYVAIASLVVVLITFSYTACSDPGIVFKASNSVSEDIESNIADSVSMEPSPVTYECNQCRIQRPHSARHCYQCAVCVDKLDHHCPFTGKCIGKRNLLAFWMFLVVLYVHGVFVIATTAYFIIAVLIIPAILSS